MDHEADVMELLARANPVPTVGPDPHPDVPSTPERDVAPRAVTAPEPSAQIELEGRPDGARQFQLTIVSLAASLVAILVAFGALIVGLRRDDGDVVPSTETDVRETEVVDTTLPSPAMPAPAPEESTVTDRAVAVVDEFVRAFNAGDLDATLSILDPGVTSTRTFGSGTADPDDELYDRSTIEIIIAEGLGSGTQLAVDDCVENDRGTQADAISLVCRWEERTDLVQAVGGDPITAEAAIGVSGDRIAEIHLGFGRIDFYTLGMPFGAWLRRYHPEVAEDLDTDATDRVAAFDQGVAWADWAQRWGDFLDEYECAPDEFCTVSIERWVAEYDEACLAESAPGNGPGTALFEHMQGVPPTTEQAPVRRELASVDAMLLGVDGPGPSQDELPGLLQRRTEAMSQLGIAEACRPPSPTG